MSPLVLPDAFTVGQVTPSILIYEPTFEGWLTAVYYVYEHKLQHDTSLQLIAEDRYTPSLISTATPVINNDAPDTLGLFI